MDRLVWQGNSKKMYDAIISGTPVLFRGYLKKSIADWVYENRVETVTEDLVFRAVNELAPPAVAKKIMPELEKLRSD